MKDVVAFFWSPDGKAIATLGIPSRQPAALQPAAGRRRPPGPPRCATVRAAPRPSADAAGVDVSLQFVDVASGAATPPAIVSLSSLFVNQVLPYFDQYALSHRVWSPDGTSILLPVVTADGVETLECCPRTDRRRACSRRARSASGAPRPSAPGCHRPDQHERRR